MAIDVKCPIGHALRVKDELAGKRIRCPKCREVIQVPDAAADDELDELEEVDDDEYGEPAPPPRSRSSQRSGPTGKRRKAAPQASSKLPLFIGGGALLVLVIGLVIWLVARPGAALQPEQAPAIGAAESPDRAKAPDNAPPVGAAADTATPAASASPSVPETAATPGSAASTAAGGVVRANSGPIAWSAVPDPGQSPKSPAAPVVLQVAGLTAVRRVAYAAPEIGQAVVLSGSKLSELQIDRYDLSNGASLGTVAGLFPGNDSVYSALAGVVSPDGTQFVQVDPKEDDRLHVWNLAEQKRLAEWVPYPPDGKRKKKIAGVWMPAANRVLTLNEDNKAATLVLWQLPECRQVYTVENLAPIRGSAVAVSPGGKDVAAFSGQSIEIFDATTGRRRGQTQSPQGFRVSSCSAVAFRSDGSELAAVLDASSGDGSVPLLTRWDMKTGAVTAHFPLPLPQSVSRFTSISVLAQSKAWLAVPYSVSSLVWAGANHLVMNDEWLVDLERKQVVWRYLSAGGTTAAGDGRCWITTTDGTRVYLTNLLLPQDELAGVLQTAGDAQTPAVLRPGSALSLKLDFPGPTTSADEFRQLLTAQLTALFQAAGLTVRDGEPVALQVRVQVSDSGKSLSFRMFGRQSGPSESSVPLKKLDCQVAIVDAQGRAVWQQSQTILEPRSHVVHGDPAVELHNQQWQQVSRWLGQELTLPYYVAASGQPVLPGQSMITPDGVRPPQ